MLLADINGDDAVDADDEEAADDNAEPDESDRRPADVAKSFSFCESPTLGGFTAIEWCAIIDGESFGGDSNLRKVFKVHIFCVLKNKIIMKKKKGKKRLRERERKEKKKNTAIKNIN